MVRLTERGQAVGDAGEEYDPDDEAIGCAGPCDDMIEAGVVAAGAEGAAHERGHESVHGDKADGEGGQAQHAARCAAEIGSEKEEGQLARSLRAHAVQDADCKHRFSAVQPLKAHGPGGLPVPTAADLPGEPEEAIDGNRETALDAAVTVAVRVFAEDSGDDANTEHDEGEADEALGPVIEALGQTHVQLKNGDAECGHGKSVAEGVGHAQAQAGAPVALHGCDVGDGGEVIVIEAMAQAQEQAGGQRGIEFPVA